MWDIILKIIYVATGLTVFWTILFFINPDKMTKFMARLALFGKSAERTIRNEEAPPVKAGEAPRLSISDFAKTIVPKNKDAKTDKGNSR